MKKKLFVLVLGIGFLILMSWIGTIFTEILPHQPTAQVQHAVAGPYQVILQVAPNPPRVGESTAMTVQLLTNSTQQPVTNARISIAVNMATMDMGTGHAEATLNTQQHYVADIQFPMNGLWQLQVTIQIPNQQPEQTTFEVMVQ